MARRATGWDTPLAAPIALKGGTLATLGDAVRFILALPELRQAAPTWHYAAELLQRAHATGTGQAIADATQQMRLALSSEGWL